MLDIPMDLAAIHTHLPPSRSAQRLQTHEYEIAIELALAVLLAVTAALLGAALGIACGVVDLRANAIQWSL